MKWWVVFLRGKGLFFSTFIILKPFSGVKWLSSDFHTLLEGAQLRFFFKEATMHCIVPFWKV